MNDILLETERTIDKKLIVTLKDGSGKIIELGIIKIKKGPFDDAFSLFGKFFRKNRDKRFSKTKINPERLYWRVKGEKYCCKYKFYDIIGYQIECAHYFGEPDLNGAWTKFLKKKNKKIRKK
jgi:hypothetical protein